MRSLAFAAVFTLAVASSSQAQNITGLEIVDAGLYRFDRVYKQANPNVVPGYFHIVTNDRLLKSTRIIPCRLGTSFGVRYRVLGDRPGFGVSLTIVRRYPHAGLWDPRDGQFKDKDSTTQYAAMGLRRITTMTFDEPQELVPGNWTYEFWSGWTKLGEVTFQVSGCPKPKAAPVAG